MTLGFIGMIWSPEFGDIPLTRDSLIRVMNMWNFATDRDRVGPLNVLLPLHPSFIETQSEWRFDIYSFIQEYLNNFKNLLISD